MGKSSDRFVLHDRPILADEVYAAHYHDSDVDWSCVHGILHLVPPESRTQQQQQEQHALVYFRKGRGSKRDIPEAIHLDFIKLLEERIPNFDVIAVRFAILIFQLFCQIQNIFPLYPFTSLP